MRVQLLFFFAITLFAKVQSQTPGALISTPFATFLNPNGDAWVTSSSSAFITNDQDESELDWVSIPQVDSEPSGDLNTGGPCGTTDIMDDPTSGADASYVLFKDPNGIPGDGDEFMLYRLRIARDPGSGNFGFSVLMDIDNTFGASDTDAVAGNPGFEVEIRVKNGGGSKALYLDDVSGTTSGSTKNTYNLSFYTQKSYALSQNVACTGKPAVFYDFMIPFADLTTHFGMTINTKIRLVGATSQNGGSVLGSSASDIAGINDNNYANSIAGQDLAFAAFINNQPGVAAQSATGFGVLPVELIKFSCEKISGVNIIKWTTGMELDNDYFEVEKSYDANIFFKIGEINGNGKSNTEINYTFADYNAEGIVYYRLKQVDFDGTFEYSSIISQQNSRVEAPEVFSTGLDHRIKIDTHGDALTTMLIYNLQGGLVRNEVLSQSEYIDLVNLSKGLYVVKVHNENGEAVQRITIK